MNLTHIFPENKYFCFIYLILCGHFSSPPGPVTGRAHDEVREIVRSLKSLVSSMLLGGVIWLGYSNVPGPPVYVFNHVGFPIYRN